MRSYLAGLSDTVHGERYDRIIRFFIPEFITSLLLYSMPIILDAYFIGSLKSTTMYSALGATNNLMNFIIKISEALSVGTVILVGCHNGKNDYAGAGNILRDAFWMTLLVGSFIAGTLFCGAHIIYTWYVPAELVSLSVPFLRLRAMGVLCMFVFMAFVGFLRGIKNTHVPMKIFLAGTVVFLIADYILIYGALGFEPMGLQGSALASVIQYLFMLIVIICYIACSKKNHHYIRHLFSIFGDLKGIMRLLSISWFMIIDKATMALAYIWLLRMMKPMGECGVATFCVVNDLQRFTFLPAIACAQIITFLVSNDLGKGNWQSVKTNIKKVTFLASILVFLLLCIVSWWPITFMQLFDKKGDFTHMAAAAFPLLSVLVFFDLVQLILAGALRGAGNVKTVLWVRLVICFGYFVPVSYIIAYHMPIENILLKFILIYGTFYSGNAIMSLIYIRKFRSGQWLQQ